MVGLFNKDEYIKTGEQLVDRDGLTPDDLDMLRKFLQSTAGNKLVGALSNEAKNNIMRMANIDFSQPNAPIEAQALRGSALALNTFIDTIFAWIEEPEPEEESA